MCTFHVGAYILLISQYYATKIVNFTNFKMLFHAVVLVINIKIQSNRGVVYQPVLYNTLLNYWLFTIT